jgi:peptidyl-prolyl cis-trans isomerase C
VISVNDTVISSEAVAREVQHHPAPTREEAEQQAATALVVRELLLQRAAFLGVDGDSEEDLLANLLDAEVMVPEPTAEEVARYYRRNGLRFMTPALYEAAHIFFPARDGDEAARAEAREKAEAVLKQVLGQPRRFGELAKLHSACSSKDQGGLLGQVSKGDTNPELELAMTRLEPGTIARTPVASRHGFHILRLDNRAPAKQLPLERVSRWIEDHLRKTSRRRAIAQYLQLLAGQARISGFEMGAAESPLVQ